METQRKKKVIAEKVKILVSSLRVFTLKSESIIIEFWDSSKNLKKRKKDSEFLVLRLNFERKSQFFPWTQSLGVNLT